MNTSQVKALAKLCYPDYKGRKFSYCERSRYQMMDYWSEGSREYCMAVRLSDMSVHPPLDVVHNPMNRGAHSEVIVPPGVVLVVRSIFCGRECGITVQAPCADLPCSICPSEVAQIP